MSGPTAPLKMQLLIRELNLNALLTTMPDHKSVPSMLNTPRTTLHHTCLLEEFLHDLYRPAICVPYLPVSDIRIHTLPRRPPPCPGFRSARPTGNDIVFKEETAS